MLVAVHGLGDAPERFAPFFIALDVQARVIAPRGPAPWHGGHAWFARSAEDPEAFVAGIRRSADAIAALIADVPRRRPTCGAPVVTGFSQGGMLAYAIATLHPARASAVFPISGLLPEPLVPRDPGGPLPPVTAFHGDADRVVPIAPAREAVARLRARGYRAELREYPGVGHTVSPAMRNDLAVALRAALVAACPAMREP